MAALAAEAAAFAAARCAVVIAGFFRSQAAARGWMADVASDGAVSAGNVIGAAGGAAVTGKDPDEVDHAARADGACALPFPLLYGAGLASAEATAADFHRATTGDDGHAGGAGVADAEPAPSDAVDNTDASASSLAFYAALGFQRSFGGTWAPDALHFYAAAAASGRALKSSAGMDVHQMGGDVLVDAAGAVLAVHYSANSTDRPTVGALLELARNASASAGARSAALVAGSAAGGTVAGRDSSDSNLKLGSVGVEDG